MGSTQIGDIVINEINYHSPDTCDTGDWVELYNAGATTIDLSGWFLQDGGHNYFNLPANTILPSDGYLVLVQDSALFQAIHPTVTNFIGGFGNSPTGGFGLSGAGEWISINNADRSYMDTVHYDDVLPWPEEADGLGSSLMLIDPSLDNALPSSWVASPISKGSPGAPNQGVLYLGPDAIYCQDTVLILDATYTPCFNCIYFWNNGATTPTIEVTPLLGPNYYTVTVTEANGNTQSDFMTITMSNPYSLDHTATDLPCNDDNYGTIDLQVIDGMGAYSYVWNNGATTQDLAFLTPGTYTVTVSDAQFCTKTLSATVDAPPPIIALTDVAAIDCYDDLASIDLTVFGGVDPYEFSWSNGDSTATAENLPPGDYTVTISDANSCTKLLDFSFDEPPQITGSFDIEPACNGLSDGYIDVDMEGGVGDYFYEWSTGESGSADDISDVPLGTYSVTVTDDTGCTWTSEIYLPGSTTIEGTFNPSDLLCMGDSSGAVQLTVGGGEAPYSYEWSNGATIQNLSALTAGIYALTITDDTGCQFYDSIEVAEPAPVMAVGTIDVVSCFGGSDGLISLSPTGGTGNYFYLWNTGDTTSSIDSLGVGTYLATVTDGNNCMGEASFVVDQNPILNASLQPISIDCNGTATGEILLTPSGGFGMYSYLWNDGSGNQNLTGVPAGTYSVTITDEVGCTYTQTAAIAENSAIIIDYTSSDLLCNNEPTGSIALTPSGGAGTFSYTWDMGDTIDYVEGLYAGTYTVAVTDSLGCTQMQNIVLTETTSSGFQRCYNRCTLPRWSIGDPLRWNRREGRPPTSTTGAMAATRLPFKI